MFIPLAIISRFKTFQWYMITNVAFLWKVAQKITAFWSVCCSTKSAQPQSQHTVLRSRNIKTLQVWVKHVKVFAHIYNSYITGRPKLYLVELLVLYLFSTAAGKIDCRYGGLIWCVILTSCKSLWFCGPVLRDCWGGGPRVVVSTAAFHARVRVRFPVSAV